MVYRYSWLAGIAAVAFALWRLAQLLEPTSIGLPWQVVVGAGLAIGAVVTWAGVTYRLKAGWIVLINLVLFLIAAGRYGAPHTGRWIFPNGDTVATLSAELERATGLIRHGLEPVDPITGLVIIVTGLFWALAAVLVYGLLRDRPYLALLPPLVVGLQLLTIERRPSSNLEIAIYVVLVAFTALAVGVDEHERGAGRMSLPGQHPRRATGPLSRAALGLVAITVLVSLGVSTAMAARIPADGVLTWRAPGSLSAGLFGSISYNPFVDIHRGLVSQSRRPLFTANLSGEPDAADLYFRLITLDTYDNEKWFASEGAFTEAIPSAFAAADQPYAGPTKLVTATIQISALKQDYLPAPYAAIGVSGRDADSFRVRVSDLSIQFANDRTYRDMEYTVAANVPVMDSGSIAVNADGGLSPLFAVARENDQTIPDPDPASDPTFRALPDADRYLQLPEDLDPGISAEARVVTGKLRTAFEKGLALEYWFREGGGFVYDLDVGDDLGPDALASWLLDDSPENAGSYRRGYCAQFALSMGVMARALGIPARVVIGFLPGERVGEGQVLVRDTNGHAWVELWIPSQGWMRFDPTPRSDFGAATYQTLNDELAFDIADFLQLVPELPVSDLLPGDSATPPDLRDRDLPRDFVPTPAPGGSGALPALGLAFTAFLVLAALVAGGIPMVKRYRLRARMRRLAGGDITAAWDVVVAQLTDLDRPIDASATPGETAATVGSTLQPLASVYSHAVYGPAHQPTAAELDTATRSMTITLERLMLDATPTERLRATYRLRSLFDGWRLSRWLPWPRR
jgi:transglutaminase-like putative cysteine protease